MVKITSLLLWSASVLYVAAQGSPTLTPKPLGKVSTELPTLPSVSNLKEPGNGNTATRALQPTSTTPRLYRAVIRIPANGDWNYTDGTVVPGGKITSVRASGLLPDRTVVTPDIDIRLYSPSLALGPGDSGTPAFIQPRGGNIRIYALTTRKRNMVITVEVDITVVPL